MLKLTGDEAISQLRKPEAIAWIIKQVLTRLAENGLVTMHTGTIDAKDRFGHKRSGQAVLGCNGFDRVFQREHVVSGLEGICEVKVNLVLAQGNLVVTDLDFQSHLVQGSHQLGAHPDSFVVGREIEVTANIMGYRADRF